MHISPMLHRIRVLYSLSCAGQCPYHTGLLTLAPASGVVLSPTNEPASTRKYSRSSAPLHFDTRAASWAWRCRTREAHQNDKGLQRHSKQTSQ